MDGLVPTIDIGPFVDGPGDEAARDAVARAVDDAARTAGFLQVVGHGIPDRTRDGLLSAMDAFFALDPETKRRYVRPPEENRGYTPPRSERLASSLGVVTPADLFEAFNVGASTADHPDLDLPPERYAGNVYPLEPAGFETAVTAWFAEARRVARTMMRIFARALGLPEDHFAAFTDHSVDVLRMNNYRLPSADVELEPEQVGMGAHTDFGMVTVLLADPVPGLEILDADGRWNPVRPGDGALLVNLGDALARWTNDRWTSTLHRVAAPRVDGRLVPRRSAAFFHDGDVDAVIECLPGCSDAAHPPRYEPITLGRHVAQKIAGARTGASVAGAGRDAARLGHRSGPEITRG